MLRSHQKRGADIIFFFGFLVDFRSHAFLCGPTYYSGRMQEGSPT